MVATSNTTAAAARTVPSRERRIPSASAILLSRRTEAGARCCCCVVAFVGEGILHVRVVEKPKIHIRKSMSCGFATRHESEYSSTQLIEIKININIIMGVPCLP